MSSFASLALCLFCSAGQQDRTKEFLHNAIEANGGREALARIFTHYSSTKGVLRAPDGREIALRTETWLALPDRARVITTAKIDGKELRTVHVLNGDKAWRKTDGADARELSKEQMIETREKVHQWKVGRLFPLLEDGYTVQLLGEDIVEGRKLLAVRVIAKGRRDVQLYFEKGTLKLAAISSRAVVPSGKEMILRDLYTGRKSFDGVEYPTRIVRMIDSAVNTIEDVTEFIPLKNVDEKLFERP